MPQTKTNLPMMALQGDMELDVSFKAPEFKASDKQKGGLSITARDYFVKDGKIVVGLTWQRCFELMKEVESSKGYQHWLRKQLLEGA